MMTMGEFRELTGDLPDDWPMVHVTRIADNEFSYAEADASVDESNRQVLISDA